MRPEPTCPRCAGRLRPPGLWSSSWECAEHGGVQPFQVLPHTGQEALEHVVTQARVPVWLRWPVPATWSVAGIGYAGDERTGARASVLATTGAGPLGGAAEVLVVAEEMGVGLGARYAGVPGPDPGPELFERPHDVKVVAAEHPTPLWALPSEDRAAFVGEAMGQWLWLVVWPAAAGVLAYDELAFVDLRSRASCPELDYVPLSDHLSAP